MKSLLAEEEAEEKLPSSIYGMRARLLILLLLLCSCSYSPTRRAARVLLLLLLQLTFDIKDEVGLIDFV